MSRNLPQSGTARIPLKAYLNTDHFTAATGITIGVTISKNGGTFGNPSAGTTTATEIGVGWYYVDLSTTDTDTLGPLIVRGTSGQIDPSEPSPYEVVNAHNGGFDGVPAVVAGASSGLPLAADASGRVDLIKINGTTVSTATAQLGVNVVNIAGAAAAVDANNLLKVDVEDWKAVAVSGSVSPDALFIRSGTAAGGGASTITLDAGASATNNLYQNAIIFIRSGAGAGQTNIISSYAGSTKIATVANAWVTNPDSSSVFTIAAPGPSQAAVTGTVNANVTQWSGTNVAAPNVGGVPKVDVVDWLGTTVTAATTAGKPDVVVVTNNDKTGYTASTVSDKTGYSLASAQTFNNTGTWTGPLTGSVGSVTGAVGSVTGAVGSVTARVTANTDQLAGQTVTAAAGVTFPTSVASPTNLTAGTLTTVTNLTNAPTAGDFTSTMKTSLNNATPSVTVSDKTGFSLSTPQAFSNTGTWTGNITGSVGSVTTVSDKTGYSLAAGQLAVKKNTAITGFTFPMYNITGTPITGLTVTATRSLDGAAFGACANLVTELSNGWYKIDLVAADTNATVIALRFSATNVLDTNITIITQA